MPPRREIRIGNRTIGDTHPCFIIADAGSCHGADLTRAYQLIDTAYEAGSDAIAFETFRADRLYIPTVGPNALPDANESNLFEIAKSAEMPYDWIPKLASYCEQKQLLLISTPYDETSADALAPYVKLFKISSYDIDHVSLIHHVAQKMKPTILPTGAATWNEIERAVEVFVEVGNLDIILMQSTALYPAPLRFINLRVITEFRNRFHVPIGLSDHSRHPTIAPLGAVSLGVNCLQKHFILSKESMSNGPSAFDHKFSLLPHELKEMVHSIRYLEEALGDGNKRIDIVEEELLRYIRRNIVATREIKSGEVFSKENVAVLRTGARSGELPASALEPLIGGRATYDYKKDDLIKAEEIQKH